MQIKFSSDAKKELRKIRKKDSKLYKKVEKQLDLFIRNPKHPSLRIHKLTGDLKNTWSLSINKSIRMTYVSDKKGIYFTDIGTHDQVYKK